MAEVLPIEIPRITIYKSAENNVYFNDFDLNVNGLNLRPDEGKIITTNLSNTTQTTEIAKTGKDFLVEDEEHTLVSLLWNKPEVDYDKCSDLLFKLSRQAINKLKSYIKPNLSSMCDDCKKRYDKNPLRVLDCKVETCQEILKDAPMILDNLCDDCKNSFNKVINSLEKLNINYKIDKKIVRGLDYYNGIVYEYTSDDLGLAIGGGGRYDTLVENLGGASTPAVGFGMGLNRVVLLLEDMKEKLKSYVDVYFLITNDEGYIKSLDVIKKLRENGYKIEQDLSEKSFRAQLKYADKIKARYVIILGEDEIKNNKCILRNMENGSQKEICFNFDEIVDNI